ncbi:glycine cleavage system aminomethyltransferase GcvT [Candidatus Margulisiibacteriota bacterium]
MTNKTPLYTKHLELKAKMIPFAGWEMPISYPTGIIAEHKAVRASCGIFDIGHMGLIKIKDKREKIKAMEDYINKITTNDVRKLVDYSSQYSIICNEEGGVVDDILVYKFPEHYTLVVNASNTDKVIDWLSKFSGEIQFELLTNVSLLAVQGPQAKGVIEKLTGTAPAVKRNHCYHYKDLIISRTGYTGEDGYELFVPHKTIEELWGFFIDQKVKPCGLGCRDTLRLEAGYPLYGNEYNDKTTPLEAGYNWAVKLDKGQFVGQEKLITEKETGVHKRLVGMVLSEKTVPRHGFKVFDVGAGQIGEVTSGTFSPSLEKPIAMAYINSGYTGNQLDVEIRGKRVSAEIVSLPFYKRKT